MPTLEDALFLAADKHRGQRDKNGQPYILHPLRVMHHLGFDATPEERMTALLHDVVEDSDVSFEDLARRGFPASVVEAVESLTTRPGEKADYFAAVRRAGAHPLGRKVKIADLADNLDLRRIPQITADDAARLEKYRKALKMLQG